MKSSQTHLPSLLGSLIFILGSTFLFSVSLLAGVAAIFTYVTNHRVDIPPIIFFVTYGFEGVLIGLIAFFSIQKFFHNPNADQPIAITINGWKIIVGGLGAALAIILGSLLVEREVINWLVLPILTIPAVAIPIWLVFGIGAQKIPLGARWQTWSVFGLSMTLAPFILVFLEIGVAMIFMLGLIIYITSRPELAFEVQRLSSQLMRLDPESPDALNLLAPYLARPITIILALSYFSIIVPALEELFKPLGVWLFGARIESISQGFALGALSGAGYALIETFGVSGQVAEWSSLLTTRIGTGLLHITTSALMGAGIIATWHHRRYLFSLSMYLLAVLLHGLWNTAAISYSFTSINIFPAQAPTSQWIETGALAGMQILSAIFLGILFFTNRKLRLIIQSTIEDTPSAPAEDSHDKITQ